MSHLFSRLLNILGTRGTHGNAVRSSRSKAKPDHAAIAAWTEVCVPRHISDVMLTKICLGWLRALPRDVRPTRLCALYPAVANRLALCWTDPVLTDRVFEDPLLDRRGGHEASRKS